MSENEGTSSIQKLSLALDPSREEERKEKFNELKRRYNEMYGDLDMEKAYRNLFEILWYSQLPCFDVKNITSDNYDELSMVKRCYWKGYKMNCSSIFVTRPTDRGMCCSFNMKKADHILRQSKYTSALAAMQDQDVKYGFENNTLPEWFLIDQEPTTQSGQDKGLRLVLDAHSDRISPSTVYDNFRGFVTNVDGGDKYPLTSKNSFLIKPGKENYVTLSAVRVEADTDIRSIKPSKRKCYFADETQLEMHNNYSRSNCILECSLKYALKTIVR
jgi:hypothetical protein